MEILVKIETLVKHRNLGKKPNFWSKIELLVKNRTFGQKSKISSKNFNYAPKSCSQNKMFKAKHPSCCCTKILHNLF